MNRFFYLLSILLIPLGLFANDVDNQAWFTVCVAKKISDSKVSAGFEQKYGNDFTDDILRRVYVSFYKRFSEHWAADVNFKQIDIIKPDRTIQWNVPYVNVYRFWHVGKLNCDFRNRLEYIFDAYADNFFRFRPQLRSKFTRPLFLNFYPYIADEIFIDFTDNHFRLNRIFVGMNKALKPLNINLFYCLQSNEQQPGWSHDNVVGCTLSATF